MDAGCSLSNDCPCRRVMQGTGRHESGHLCSKSLIGNDLSLCSGSMTLLGKEASGHGLAGDASPGGTPNPPRDSGPADFRRIWGVWDPQSATRFWPCRLQADLGCMGPPIRPGSYAHDVSRQVWGLRDPQSATSAGRTRHPSSWGRQRSRVSTFEGVNAEASSIVFIRGLPQDQHLVARRAGTRG
jgi:hypothetical protein